MMRSTSMLAERTSARRTLGWMLAALAVTAIAAVRAAQPTPIVSSPSSGAEDALIRALMIEIQLREKEIKGLHF